MPISVSLESNHPRKIDALFASNTYSNRAPFVSFFLNIHYAPARKMIDQGLELLSRLTSIREVVHVEIYRY